MMRDESHLVFLPMTSEAAKVNGDVIESFPTLIDESALTEGPGTRIGRYELLEKIGEGGFGSVWAAEQCEVEDFGLGLAGKRRKALRRRVALKIIKLGMDTEQVVGRFEAERQVLALMDHPSIAKVLDAGATDSGRPYFVMELVNGVTITKYCDQEKLSIKARLELFIKVCQAVQHAHQKGIIHRDLKPSNVMVAAHESSEPGVPKVIDFGIAKATRQELTGNTIYTQSGQFLGTPAYMSPEQSEMNAVGAGDIDTRSDVYSLGVLLYELLTGTTPFDAKELLQSGIDGMRKIIREREPLRPSTRLSQMRARGPTPGTNPKLRIENDLDWIVMKCLEKDRNRRYETANGLAMDIQRHLHHEPVVARPPSAAYKFQKAWRRNKVAATSALMVGIIVLLALAFSSWSFVRERQARINEASQLKIADYNQLLAEANAGKALEYAESLRRTAYTADMGLALQTVENGNLGRARKLLDRHRPLPDQVDIRGFEWRYLWARSRSQARAILGGYHGFSGGVAISPDGSLVASIDTPNIVVRSLSDGTLVKRIDNVLGPVIKFSPSGHHLLAEDSDTAIRRWNTADWMEESRLEGLRAPFAFASQGKALAAWAGDHLAVWDTATWTPQKRFSATAELQVFNRQSLATSPDGNILFRGGDQGKIRSWNIADDRELEPLDTGIRHTIPCLAVSSRGILAAAHFTGQVTLWDIRSRQRLDLLHDHRSWVSTVAFSSDGSVLASASADRTLAVYDVHEDGSAVFRERLSGHEGEVWAMALTPDARWICTGSEDGTLLLWSVGERSVAPQGNLPSIPLEFTRSGRGLVGWSEDGALLELEVATGKAAPLVGMPAPLNVNLGAQVWALDSYNPLKNRVTLRKWAALVTVEGLEIWNIQTGELERSIPDPQIDKQSCTFSDDGSLFAATSHEMGLRLWQTSDWSFKQLIPDRKSGGWTSLCFSMDNKKLVGMNRRGNVLIDLVSEEIVMPLDIGEVDGMATAFSSDGEYFAAGTMNNRIHLWNILRKEKLYVLDGHVAGVRGLSVLAGRPHSRQLR
jgi:eukaryotic-like serine/threonine-protein kinase